MNILQNGSEVVKKVIVAESEEMFDEVRLFDGRM